ncbi:MAG: transposase, partial [SAR202 cluster bacterium]|nr:transposase [SAR202 cluster bacterium]
NDLNRHFQRYLVTYNTVRPHMGLGMKTPKEVVALYHKS